MRRDELRLRDIVAAADALSEYLEGARKERFESPGIFQDAVLRQLTIAGEATFKVSRPLQARYPLVPWQQIASFRHRLVHDYFGLDLDAVWRIATVEMPLLRALALEILSTEFPQPPLGL